MIIRMYPIDGLKGQKQIAYGNAIGLENIRCRPERAKAQSLFLLLPFQGDRSASHLTKALLRDVALIRQRKLAFFVPAMHNVALGYYVVAPLGRYGELRIIIFRNRQGQGRLRTPFRAPRRDSPLRVQARCFSFYLPHLKIHIRHSTPQEYRMCG